MEKAEVVEYSVMFRLAMILLSICNGESVGAERIWGGAGSKGPSESDSSSEISSNKGARSGSTSLRM